MTTANTLVENSRVVVFDLDGTLVDTFDDLWLSLDSALEHHAQAPAPRAVVMANLHLGLDGTARAILDLQGADADVRESVIATYRKHYRERHHRASRLYPGVREFIEQCRRQGQPMAVCTNKIAVDACELLEVLEVTDYFAEIIGIDSCGRAKPDPAPVRQILELLDCHPGDAIFIGDSEIDAACAKNAAVPFLLHEAGFGAEGARAIGYDGSFHSYRDLLV